MLACLKDRLKAPLSQNDGLERMLAKEAEDMLSQEGAEKNHPGPFSRDR